MFSDSRQQLKLTKQVHKLMKLMGRAFFLVVVLLALILPLGNARPRKNGDITSWDVIKKRADPLRLGTKYVLDLQYRSKVPTKGKGRGKAKAKRKKLAKASDACSSQSENSENSD